MPQSIQTVAFWDAAVEAYEKASEPFTAHFCREAATLLDPKAGQHVLDIGAGPGALALALAGHGATVTAVDFAPAMTRRLAERAGRLPITARTMDGQALDFPSGSFDAVASVFGISLFPDWRRGLSEMVRVLRPGGHAVLAVAASPHGLGPNSLLAEARSRVVGPVAPEIAGQARLANAPALLAALESAGLTAIRIEPRTHTFRLPLDLLSTASPMIVGSPLLADLQPAARAAVVAEARRHAEADARDGIANLPATAHLAIGIRAVGPAVSP